MALPIAKEWLDELKQEIDANPWPTPETLTLSFNTETEKITMWISQDVFQKEASSKEVELSRWVNGKWEDSKE